MVIDLAQLMQCNKTRKLDVTNKNLLLTMIVLGPTSLDSSGCYNLLNFLFFRGQKNPLLQKGKGLPSRELTYPPKMALLSR